MYIVLDPSIKKRESPSKLEIFFTLGRIEGTRKLGEGICIVLDPSIKKNVKVLRSLKFLPLEVY